jgi:hypothetical protein
MALTEITYTGDGSDVTFGPIPFDYLEATDVKVSLNGVITSAFTIDPSTKIITFSSAPGDGVSIRVFRRTDFEDLSATFISGSAIRAQDLNDNFNQNLYVTQEISNYAITNDGLVAMEGDLDMGNYRITNLAEPTAANNAATKQYIDTRLGSLSVPGFTRWSLTAVGGETTLSGAGTTGGTLAYSANREQVYLNGAQLQRDADYTANNGTSVVLNIALTAGDVVEIICVNNLNTGTTAQAQDVSFVQSGAGAVTRSVENKLRDVVSVKDFGAVGDGVTDDTVAIQNALNFVADNRGTLSFGTNSKYKITAPITITWNAARKDTKGDIKIDGCGCFIDASALSGSETAFSFEGTSNYPIEVNLIFSRFEIFGPESTSIKDDIDSRATTTAGLKFEFCLGATVEDCSVFKFYNGVYFSSCWPIYSQRNQFSYNGIGLFLADNCTLGFHNSEYDENYIGLLLSSTSSPIYNQTFTSCLFQNCSYGVVVGGGNSTSIYSLIFDNPYFEGIINDAFSFGYGLGAVPPALGGKVYNVSIKGGTWSNIGGKPIRGSSQNIDFINIDQAYGITDVSDIGGTIRSFTLNAGNSSLSPGTYTKTTRAGSEVVRHGPFDNRSGLGPSMFFKMSSDPTVYMPGRQFFKRVFCNPNATTTIWSINLETSATYYFESDILMRRSNSGSSSVYKVAFAARVNSSNVAAIIGNLQTLASFEDDINVLSLSLTGTTLELQSQQGNAGQYASGYVTVTRIYQDDW